MIIGTQKMRVQQYTVLDHPSALEAGTTVPQDEAPPHTYCLLNSGVFP